MKKLLIVDDSVTIIDVLSFTLRNGGYDVSTATNGVEALEMLDGRHFDLMITDLYMPQMDGIELIRNTRKIKTYHSMPILFLTTESSQEKKESAKSAGATGWIIKPFAPEKLLSAVNKILGNS